MNVLFHCRHNVPDANGNNNTRDDVILRVFGNVQGLNRDMEIEIMRTLSENEIIPPVYGR